MVALWCQKNSKIEQFFRCIFKKYLGLTWFLAIVFSLLQVQVWFQASIKIQFDWWNGGPLGIKCSTIKRCLCWNRDGGRIFYCTSNIIFVWVKSCRGRKERNVKENKLFLRFYCWAPPDFRQSLYCLPCTWWQRLLPLHQTIVYNRAKVSADYATARSCIILQRVYGVPPSSM